MKMFKMQSGPFKERPFYHDSDFESIARDALSSVDLLPTKPRPIRVDRFIEKRFGIVHNYEETPTGILGYTRFGSNGPLKVVVSRSLSEEGSRAAERRINSTLAHEAGHMLLHGHLFAMERREGWRPLFGEDIDEGRQTILCREDAVGVDLELTGVRRYDGRWWEFQANKVIGALLLPRRLVNEALTAFTIHPGRLGIPVLKDTQLEETVLHLVKTFDVNAPVARIRLQELFRTTSNGQLTL